MNYYALEVQNVSKQLDKFSLENINFMLEPGYMMGLIGPNGAGKSTLILTLLGLYKKTEGNIKIYGYDLEKQERQAKEQIGFILDENPFVETMSAKENGTMYGRYYSNWEQDSFERYLRTFEIDPKKPLKKLSKGTKIKFQLAFALSHRPRLLVMDEPTSGLDPIFRRELIEILCDLISCGENSILFSTHLTSELDKVADYITFIYKGKQLFSLSKEEMLMRYGLIKGSKKEITDLPEAQVVGVKLGENYSEALIIIDDNLFPMKHVSIQKPTIEDIMFYTVNG